MYSELFMIFVFYKSLQMSAPPHKKSMESLPNPHDIDPSTLRLRTDAAMSNSSKTPTPPSSSTSFKRDSGLINKIATLCLVLCSMSILSSLPSANGARAASKSSAAATTEKRVVCYYTSMRMLY